MNSSYRLPDRLAAELDALGDDTDAVTEFGIDYATRQVDELLRGGAPGVHIYSLNKVRAAVEIVRRLGLR
jgi:methylenetetrahydrofolate reductase (NADPH)